MATWNQAAVKRHLENADEVEFFDIEGTRDEQGRYFVNAYCKCHNKIMENFFQLRKHILQETARKAQARHREIMAVEELKQNYLEKRYATAAANGNSRSQVTKRRADANYKNLLKEIAEYEKGGGKYFPLTETCGAVSGNGCWRVFIHPKMKENEITCEDGKVVTVKVPSFKECHSVPAQFARQHIEGCRERKCRLTGDPNQCPCPVFREVLRKAVNEAIKELLKEHELLYGLEEADWSEKQRAEFAEKKKEKSKNVIGEEIDNFFTVNGIKAGKQTESGKTRNAKIKEHEATVGFKNPFFDLADGFDLINGPPELKSYIEKLIDNLMAAYPAEFDLIKAKVQSQLKIDFNGEPKKPNRMPKVEDDRDCFILENRGIIVTQLSIALLMLFEKGELKHCDSCNRELYLGEDDRDYQKGLKLSIEEEEREAESNKRQKAQRLALNQQALEDAASMQLTQNEKWCIKKVTTAQYKRCVGFFFELDRRFNGTGHNRLNNLNVACHYCNCLWRNDMSYDEWMKVLAEDKDGRYKAIQGRFKEETEDGSVVWIPDLRARLKSHGLDILNIPSVIALYGNEKWKDLARKAGYDLDPQPGDLQPGDRRDRNAGASSSSSDTDSDDSDSCKCKISCENRTQNQNTCKCSCHRTSATSAASSSHFSSSSSSSRQSGKFKFSSRSGQLDCDDESGDYENWVLDSLLHNNNNNNNNNNNEDENEENVITVRDGKKPSSSSSSSSSSCLDNKMRAFLRSLNNNNNQQQDQNKQGNGDDVLIVQQQQQNTNNNNNNNNNVPPVPIVAVAQQNNNNQQQQNQTNNNQQQQGNAPVPPNSANHKQLQIQSDKKKKGYGTPLMTNFFLPKKK